MPTPDLLQTLTADGFTLTRIGSDIDITGPAEKLTPELKQRLRESKPELLERLASLEAMAVERSFRKFIRLEPGPIDCPVPPVHDAGEPVCERCGSSKYRDMTIHGGQSTRRDCASCHRTIDFPKWQPRQQIVQMDNQLANDRLKA